ncbi:cytochrome c [Niveibacterium sp. 24ML]|uniref:c-type cytochrome n=1 Tax=Niveibacterium sp. 24ML TaxID=2985512 RepID=UPI00226F31CB|nr:cytochrome c [Niveibacterium sp. 24ML]MCX9156130.1 cytochrome c [Niveibacterium sp. 24ML]
MTRASLTTLLVLAGLWSAAANAGDAVKGKEKSAACAACHGADGNSAAPDFPKLAGQHADYLVRALTDYKAGKRKNPIMMGMAAPLSKQDMADLAAYYSAQKGLVIVKR